MKRIFLALMFFVLISNVFAVEIINGEIKNSDVWKGEIFIDGDILIPEGVTLTILPGSKIRFFPARSRDYDIISKNFKNPRRHLGTVGKCDIIVYGTLNILGNSKSPIYIGNSARDQFEKDLLGWGSIIVTKNGTAKIKNTVIKNAETGLIIAGKSKVSLTSSTIKNCKIGVLVANETEPYILNNKFVNNLIGLLVTDKSIPRIYNNTFISNTDAAVLIKDIAYPLGDSNTFKDNASDIRDERNIQYKE